MVLTGIALSLVLLMTSPLTSGATSVELSSQDVSHDAVVLGWTRSGDGERFLAYVLLMDDGTGFREVHVTSNIDQTSHKVTGLKASTDYSFKVRDLDKDDKEADSNVVTVRTQAAPLPGFELPTVLVSLTLAFLAASWWKRRKGPVEGRTPNDPSSMEGSDAKLRG